MITTDLNQNEMNKYDGENYKRHTKEIENGKNKRQKLVK